MKRFKSWMLSLGLACGILAPGAGATGLAGDEAAEAGASRAAVAATDSLALLPPSDLVLVLDADRLVKNVLPKVREAWPQQMEKPLREIDEFTARTGIDLTRVKTVSVGVSMAGRKGSGAVIFDGLTLDPAKLATLTKEAGIEQTGTVSYKGKTIYLYKSTKKPQQDDKGESKDARRTPDITSPGEIFSNFPGQLGLELDEDTAFVQLDQDRVALGDQADVKKVIDAAAGAAGGVSAALSSALREAGSTGIIRFAVDLPESTRQWLAGQDYFKDLAATQMIFGSLDVDSDLSLMLDAKLRTPSSRDAAKIEATLNGLLAVGRMMLGGNDQPMMQALSQLLNEIRLSSQVNDVSLGVKIPRTLFDQVFKADPKAAGSRSDK